MKYDRTALAFIFTCFVIGICGSFFFPLVSLFLVEQLGASAFELSVFMMVSVVSTVVVSQFIAKRSDQNWRRKPIMLVAIAANGLAVTCFIFLTEFWVALVVCSVLGSVGGAMFGQLFALAREYADKHLADRSTSFLSTMRAGLAVAWVFGPPLAFIIKGHFGFSVTFAIAAFITLLNCINVALFLPDAKVDKSEEQTEIGKPWYKQGRVVAFSFILLMMCSANHLYVTSMPLFTSLELGYAETFAGLLLGVAAFFEIPIMLGAGRLSKRFGTQNLMMVAAASGTIFYVGISMATSEWQFIALQIFNGVFVGLVSTLGMVALQDTMPKQLGVASTLFTNILQVSSLVSSLAIGLVAQQFSYFSLNYVSLGATLLALLLLASVTTRVVSRSKATISDC